MRTLNPDQIKLIYTALSHYANQQDDAVNQHYFEDDNGEVITQTQSSIKKIQDMQRIFSTEKNLYLMTEMDYQSLQTSLNKADDFNDKEKNYIKKSGVFLGLLHSIKQLIDNKI